MIKELKLKNFQAYKDSKLEFENGVNVIVGATDSGKTAIIRAMNWVLQNKPNGLSICSNWNRDDKDNINEPFSVKLINEKGSVERNRSKSFNGYIVNEKKLGAIKMDVPQDVKEVLNLDDVNIQFQMDSPFLLSMSGPEATKLLNRIVKLDCIDSVLSKSESQRRDLNSQLKVTTNDLKKAQKEVEDLAWTEKACDYLQKIDLYVTKVQGLLEEKCALDMSLGGLISKQAQIFPFDLLVDDKLEECEEAFQQLKVLENQKENLNAELTQLSELKVVDLEEAEKCANNYAEFLTSSQTVATEYEEFKETVGRFKALCAEVKDFSGVDMVLPPLEAAFQKISASGLETDVKNLKNQIESFKSYANSLVVSNKSIEEMESQLPDVCPYCGSTLCKEN